MIFVYNANSGAVNALWDIAHKLFSPNTYACQLCTLTYDTFFENQQWQAFRENNTLDMQFLHKDEFEKRYHAHFEYPVVLKLETKASQRCVTTEDHFSVLLKASELFSMQDTQELINALSQQVSQKNVHNVSNSPLITSS